MSIFALEYGNLFAHIFHTSKNPTHTSFSSQCQVLYMRRVFWKIRKKDPTAFSTCSETSSGGFVYSSFHCTEAFGPPPLGENDQQGLLKDTLHFPPTKCHASYVYRGPLGLPPRGKMINKDTLHFPRFIFQPSPSYVSYTIISGQLPMLLFFISSSTGFFLFAFFL
jgi:hypothetical protein